MEAARTARFARVSCTAPKRRSIFHGVIAVAEVKSDASGAFVKGNLPFSVPRRYCRGRIEAQCDEVRDVTVSRPSVFHGVIAVAG